MNKFNRIIIGVLTLGVVFSISRYSEAATKVKISSSNFPDSVFRSYVSKYFDSNKDGYLSSTELSKIRKINLNKQPIGIDDDGDYVFDYNETFASDLKGIEFFSSLEELYFQHNSVSNIDLSKNTKLKYLNCGNNYIKSLNLSKNSALISLYCDNNLLTSLDVRNNKKIQILRCEENNLKNLDVSNNVELIDLRFLGNQISSVDVSHNSKLLFIECSFNNMKTIDISKNKSLTTLICNDNKLKKIDIKNNSSLKYFMCWNNDLEELDITSNPNLLVCDCQKQDDDFCLYVKAGQTFMIDDGLVNSTRNPDLLSCKKINWTDPVGDKFVMWSLTAKKAGKTKIDCGEYGSYSVRVMYKDVINPNDFWFEPTYYLSDYDIVRGYDNQTKFKPENICTRAQMVTFLWRLEGEPKPELSDTVFTDIKKSDYFYKAVLWAVENGITTGVSENLFGPQIACTRAQTVTFLWRMAGRPTPKNSICKFSDVRSTDYFYQATIWATEMKIVVGYSDGTFKPQGKCLRRQMVTFLYKYDKYENRNDDYWSFK